jgi:hypothetical protein
MTKEEMGFVSTVLAAFRLRNLLEISVSAGGSSLVLIKSINRGVALTSIDIADGWWQNSEFPTGWFVNEVYPDYSSEQWTLYPA